MTKRIKILIPQGCRSDAGLIEPIIKRLQKSEWCECDILQLSPSNYLKSYEITSKYLLLHKPDLVLCVGDRVEMTACACCVYHDNIEIAHFYSGIIGSSYTFDDINRHVITLYSNIQFCENEKAKRVTEKILNAIGKTPNAFIVGISHFDDFLIDESKVPIEEYDLVLLNAITYPNTHFDYKGKWEKKRKQIWIQPNPDFNSIMEDIPSDDFWYNTLPRSEFLGLLKNCMRFISNSSIIYYEAPYFLKNEQIILIGKRNKSRSTDYNEIQFGASDKIVEILKEYFKLNNGSKL